MNSISKLAAPAFLMLGSLTAIAQETGQAVPSDTAVPSLMFFTFAAVIAVLGVALAMFLRKRWNRVATERGLGLSDTPINAPDDKRRK